MTSPVRTVAVVTVNRADYAIVLPVLRRIEADPSLRLHLIVTGSHLSPEFGYTAAAIMDDGFEIGDRVEMLLSSDTPEGVSKSIGLGTIGFAQLYGRFRPDILVVSADRFEMFAAAVAAMPFRIPIAHIEGGDLTEGVVDDAIRHSVTKMSHLHFVSTEEYARRVTQLGEEPWRITVSGAPSLDNLKATSLLSRDELARKYDMPMVPAPLLVTFHPVTLEVQDTEIQIRELLAALEMVNLPVIFTMPNADTSGRTVVAAVRQFAERRASAHIIDNLGTRDYLSVMASAVAMVGNSSSGIIEAPSFKLPVVNVGTRQRGRARAANVIDVGYGRDEIARAIHRAVGEGFRATLHDLGNPYGDGNAAARIVERLKTVVLDDELILKRFNDLRAS